MDHTPEHTAHIRRVANDSQAAAEDSLIAGSWRRCLVRFQLDPSHTPRNPVLESHNLREHSQRLDYLISVAEQELIDLYNQMQGSGYSIFMTDGQGIILRQICDPGYASGMRQSGLRLGADWSEGAAGTNGIGTCIAEQRPLTVHLDQHFHAGHTALSCSAAPIRDPAGQLLAVLDSSTVSAAAPQQGLQTLGLVRNTASFIEGLYFLRLYRTEIIIHLSNCPDLVAQPRNPMLAVGADGRVAGVNERALLMLGAADRRQLIGRAIDAVLDLRHCTINAASAGQLHRLRVQQHGRELYALWQGAAPAAPAPRCEPGATVTGAPPPPQLHGDPALLKSAERAARLIDQGMCVLILGDTGAGKDTVAAQIHQLSGAADEAMAAVDCGASSAAQFFDGVRSGARATLPSLLYLDQLDRLSAAHQLQLIDWINQAERGERRALRVLASARVDLEAAIAAGRFSQDLYFRLAQYRVAVPPLRARRDPDALFDAVLAQECRRAARSIELEAGARAALHRHPWPGNVRELRNVLRRAVTLCEGRSLAAEHLELLAPLHAAAGLAIAVDSDGRWEGLEATERAALLQALRATNWNIARAAREAGISRNTLYRKMRKYELSAD